MRISFRTLSALCSIATIGTLAVFASAFSQSAYAASASELDQALSPHRAMVRTALAPQTGSMNDSGNTMQLASNS